MVEKVISGGTIVSPSGTYEGSVAIDDGQIVAVGRERNLPAAEERIDATGQLVMPGVVDPHTHIDEVPANRAGTYRAETAAAASGGVTTLVDFAFQAKDRAMSVDGAPLIEGIEHKQAKGEESLIDFSVHGVLHLEDRPVRPEIETAIDAGVTSFKMFRSDYPIGVRNGFIAEAFEAIAEFDAVAALHTEDASICSARTERLKREGRGDPAHYPDSRPDYVEAMAAEDAVRLARELGTKYYGVHTTCRKSADIIEQFQTDGSQIRAETCVHYTTLDDSVYDELGNLAKIAPPIRSADDNEAMFEHLRAGTLSVVSTDHAVYHRDAKEVDDFWDSPFGANSLEVSLPVFHDEAVVRRGFSYPFLVQVMCTNPARTFGMPQKGTLEPGTDADIVLFDPTETFTISAEDYPTNSTYSIYEDREVTGRVTRTFVRGSPVFADGEVVAEPGHGSFVERELPDWGR
jgi:dihydropyrimidinase